MSYIPMARASNQGLAHYLPVSGLQACADPRACKLKVEGRGTIRVQPDTAVIIIGVSTEDVQLRTAQEENTRITTAVLNTLRNLGVPSRDITTQAYVIEPQYDFIDGRQVFRGYRVLHSLRITIRDINRIGEIIDSAVASGANIVNNISFTVSDPSLYYRQALNAAIDDAQAKAVVIGRKLNIAVSQVPVQITEEDYQYVTPIQPFLAQAAPMTTPIQAGQIEITARIEAVFAYAPLVRS